MPKIKQMFGPPFNFLNILNMLILFNFYIMNYMHSLPNKIHDIANEIFSKVWYIKCKIEPHKLMCTRIVRP
jgi:hypothetical protein